MPGNAKKLLIGENEPNHFSAHDYFAKLLHKILHHRQSLLDQWQSHFTELVNLNKKTEVEMKQRIIIRAKELRGLKLDFHDPYSCSPFDHDSPLQKLLFIFRELSAYTAEGNTEFRLLLGKKQIAKAIRLFIRSIGEDQAWEVIGELERLLDNFSQIPFDDQKERFLNEREKILLHELYHFLVYLQSMKDRQTRMEKTFNIFFNNVKEKPAQSPAQSTQTYEGILEKITYQDGTTGFMVGRFKLQKPLRIISFRGNVYNVSEGDSLLLNGSWVTHPTYGPQFKVESYAPIEPQTNQGITNYLASGRFKNIGRKTAEQIVNRFGNQTLKVIDKTPEKLLKLSLVNQKKLKILLEGRSQLKGMEEIFVFLHDLRISPSLIGKIFDKYGLESINVIKENPYRLAHEIKGIGFKIADTIAETQNIPKNSPKRAEAAIFYFLDILSQEGHTCYPQKDLIQFILKELANPDASEQLSEAILVQAVQDLINLSLLYHEKERDLLFLKYFYFLEQKIAKAILSLLEFRQCVPLAFSSSKLEKLENSLKIQLHPTQKKAIQLITENKLLILTGGPGTGKTTIVRFLLHNIAKSGVKIVMATPTGKASKRLAEVTGWEVKTIHRLLEFSGAGPARNAENPLDCDFLILDECSMIDESLFFILLNALPPTTRLLMIGDQDQLPSVGPGAILRDLLDGGKIPHIRLEQIFRQGETSFISLQAHRIIKGAPLEELPIQSQEQGEKLRDFHFVSIPKRKQPEGELEKPRTDHERIIHNLLTLFFEKIPARYGFKSGSIQILTPMKVGTLGTENLNRVMQDKLFPKEKPFFFGNKRFFVGDRVIQTKNDYTLDVFNGDQGHVIKGSPESLLVRFDEREIAYSKKEVDNLQLAWAMTIHKSQGSEFSCIIVLLCDQHYVMLQRNLLYTAVTRGKELVILLGEKNALKKAIGNESTVQRFTFLRERLHENSY